MHDRRASRRLAARDELGVDSIWFWDHFFPLYGDPEDNQFECWRQLEKVLKASRA